MKKSNKLPKQKKERGKNINFKNIFLIALMSLMIFAVSFAIFFITYIVITAPTFDPEALYKKEATIINDKYGKEIAKLGLEKREMVSYDELPEVLIDAIIATEDSRFFQHSGFDLPRFARAFLGQLRGQSAGGASTLTMQLSKNDFTDTNAKGIQGLIRKFTDIYMAVFQIEKTYTKEEIIEFYVNSPWLAKDSYGVEQASWRLFGKSVRDLNLAESSLLAGLFQSPYSYNPYVNPDLAHKRRNTVLSLMVRHGYITEEEKEAANKVTVESMLIGSVAETNNPWQPFIDTVVEEVIDRTGNNPYNVPMIIDTTMDPAIQEVINDVMTGKSYKFVNDTVQTAVAVTDVENGAIVGIGNGRNKVKEREFNLATMMKRHPGSTAKPLFDYAPYIEFNNGSSYSMVFDEPMSYSNGTSVKNWDGGYNGLMTSRQALFQSRNIPAVQVFQYLDQDKLADFIHSIGIDYGAYLYESAAIGGFDGVSPLQMSAAYAIFPRGGYYIEPYSYTKITYRMNDEVVELKPKREKVLSEETAYIVNMMLVYNGANGVAGNLKVEGTDIGAKTGTSTFDNATLSKYKMPGDSIADAWLASYTPDYSMAVWYGYEKLKEGQFIRNNPATTIKKAITTTLGNKIYKKNSRFTAVPGVVRMEVELETFPPMLPSAYTPSNLRTSEYFKRGTEPADVSPRFETLPNPTNGTSVAVGTEITLNWNAIDPPWAVHLPSLQEYFSSYYKSKYNDFSVKYYERRLNYNNANIGNVGYEVYLKNNDGTLNRLGYTVNNSFIYTVPGTGNYTFVIKTAYSIFKDNISSGIEINTSIGGGIVIP